MEFEPNDEADAEGDGSEPTDAEIQAHPRPYWPQDDDEDGHDREDDRSDAEPSLG